MAVSDEKNKRSLSRQSTLNDEQRQLVVDQFRVVFDAFVTNRRRLIWELRKIVDKTVGVSKGCAISKLAGSSVGLGGGAVALAGLVAFPPIVLAGGIAAGMAAVWNIGTQVVEYKMSPSQLHDEAKDLTETDALHMVQLNALYRILFKMDMDDVEAQGDDGFGNVVNDEKGLASAVGRGASEMIGSGAELAAVAGRRAARVLRSGKGIANAEKGTAEVAGSGMGIVTALEEVGGGLAVAEAAGAEAAVVTGTGTAELIGSAGGEMATAAGVGSAEMLGLGGQVLQGVAQGAIVFGVAMDVVQIISSARALSKGSATKFSETLSAEISRREAELDAIRSRAIACGLLEPPKPVQLHLMQPAEHI